MTARRPSPEIPLALELLTFEELAVRARVSVDTVKKYYDGPVCRRFGVPRVSTVDLARWLDSPGAEADTWDGVGEDGQGAVSKRQSGEAA